MATVQNDIAKPQERLGEKKNQGDMVDFAKEIQEINKERTDRYFDLVGRIHSDDKKRDGIIRRVVPKK